MKTIHAIFENGVFHPKEQVDLPEHSEVEFEPKIIPAGKSGGNAMKGIREILSRKFKTDQSDLAARHNEHQP